MTEKKKNTAVAVVEKFDLPALPRGEDVAEEMDGLGFTFERIKIPSGGGLAFEIPGEDDDEPDLVKEIEGVIVFHHPVNAYWAEAYTGQNNPPDCASTDGRYGEGEPGGICQTCLNNQFGSDGTNGKLCKNMRRIYILQEGEMFPLLLTLPPTSLGNFSRYISRGILQKGLRSHKVITKVALKKATSSGGINYSQATFRLAGVLPEGIAREMEKYGNFIKEVSSGVTIDTAEYNTNGADTEIKEETPF